MIRQFSLFSTTLAAAILLLAGSRPANGQIIVDPLEPPLAGTGFGVASNSTLLTSPNRFVGLLIADNAQKVTLTNRPYGATATVATDKRILQTSANASFNGTDPKNPFGNHNFFIAHLNVNNYPNSIYPTSDMGVPLRGYVYATTYGNARTKTGLANVQNSYGVYYAQQDLIAGNPPEVSFAPGAGFGPPSVQKLVTGYAGLSYLGDYRVYTTGSITNLLTQWTARGITNIYVLDQTIPPASSTASYPTLGMPLFVKAGNSDWLLAGIAAGTVGSINNTTTNISAEGEQFIMCAGTAGPLIETVKGIVANLSHGVPSPRVTFSSFYRATFQGTAAAPFNVQVSNGGSGTLQVDITASASWISVVPKHATVKHQAKVVTITLNHAKKLKAGMYTGTVEVTGLHGSKTINVSLRVKPPKNSVKKVHAPPK